LLEQKRRREASQKRAAIEVRKLEKIQLINSCEDLALAEIENSTLTKAKKREAKMSLLKNQIKLRKKVYKQDIRIPFSQQHKKRTIAEIASDLMEVIDFY